MSQFGDARYRARHPLWTTWASMRQRCLNPNDDQYPDYGGRGIKVTPEWETLAPFEAWIMANLGPRPEGMSLDRINNDGDYEPGNVRWATHQQQRLNSRPKLGRTQRAALISLSNQDCSVRDIAYDWPWVTESSARSALMTLWRRGLVEVAGFDGRWRTFAITPKGLATRDAFNDARANARIAIVGEET